MMLSDYIAIDLETTGLDAEKDEIIEIALVRFQSGQVVDSLNALVKPEQQVRPFIFQLTGIDPQELDAAQPFSEVVPLIADFVKDLPLVAHNAIFDARFLTKALKQHQAPSDYVFFDTLLLSRLVWQNVGNHRLETLVQALGIKRSSIHRALPDAEACGHLMYQALQKIEQFSPWEKWHLAQLAQNSNWSSIFPLPDVSPENPYFIPVAEAEPAELLPEPPSFPDRIRPWMNRDGVLSEHLPGYTPRKLQLQYAEIEERNLYKGGIAVLEAETGTGKTLGYLLPALLKASQSNDRILISTSTRALQEQLWQKDLPALTPLFGSKIRPALVKGRQNYLCLRKMEEHLRYAEKLLTEEEHLTIMPLISWVTRSLTGDTGENAGFHIERNRQLWNKLQSDSSTCVGKPCTYYEQCFGLKARRRAGEANIVLTNHYLALQDLNLDFSLLPPYEHAIFDEAHRLPMVSHEVFGKRIWFFRFRNHVKILAHVKSPENGLLAEIEDSCQQDEAAQSLAKICRSRIQDSEKQLHRLFIKIGKAIHKLKNKQNLRFTMGLQAEFNCDPKPALEALASLKEGLTQLSTRLRELDIPVGFGRDLEGSATLVEEFRKDLEFVTLAQRDDWAFWLEEPGNPHTLVIQAQPLEPGSFWAQKFHPWIHSALFTSATLVAENDMSFFESQMGLRSRSHENFKRPFSRVLHSSWDVDEMRQIIIVDFLPKPNDNAFQDALDDFLCELLPQVPRNTLALYTSINSLIQSHSKLSEPFAKAGKTLMSQHSDGTVDNLVEVFRKHQNACLMGTQMLWEGVDLPGEALELLVIPKLPFPTPGNSLIQAKGEMIRARGGNSFKELFVPEAILSLRQGLGRLIRHEEDRGAVLLLDKRLTQEKYGRSFTNLWKHKHHIAHDMDEVKQLLGLAKSSQHS